MAEEEIPNQGGGFSPARPAAGPAAAGTRPTVARHLPSRSTVRSVKRSPWAAVPTLLCLLALLWPVQGTALTGVTDGPAGPNLADSSQELRRCEPPIALGLDDAVLRTQPAEPTSELLMEQHLAATCNSKKGMRWQICAAVLAVALYRRRRPEETSAVRTQVVVLGASVAVAALGVTVVRSLGWIYTSASHILWVSVVLYLVTWGVLDARRSEVVDRPDEPVALDH